jgi:hypothetical protein
MDDPTPPADLVTVKEIDMQELRQRLQAKIFQDLQTNGFRSISTRHFDQGEYSHTLGVTSDTPDGGSFRIHLIQLGIYEKDKPDQPRHGIYKVIYWVADGSPLGLKCLALDMEEDSRQHAEKIIAIGLDGNEIKLKPEQERQYLKVLVEDLEKAKPNAEVTAKMKASVEDYGVEVQYLRDLRENVPQITGE